MTAISEQLRFQVVARAGGRCEYCRLPTVGQVATFPIDHIVPRTEGGQTVPESLALAYPHCNAHKWAFVTGVDPETGHPCRLFNPRIDVWAEHFAWSTDDPTVLIGRTSVGRATIPRLQMNAPEMLTTRRLLLELGIG